MEFIFMNVNFSEVSIISSLVSKEKYEGLWENGEK